MPNIILSYHEEDEETANSVAAYLKSKKHTVYLDKNPFTESQWEGGWAEIYPKAEYVLFLITRNLVEHIDTCHTNEEKYTVLNRISKSAELEILPVFIEKVDMPDTISDYIAFSCVGQKIEYMSKHLEAYIVFLSNKKNSSFKRKMLWLSVFFLAFSTIIYFMISSDKLIEYGPFLSPVYMLSLGALGAISYILFNLIGIFSEETFRIENTVENYLRIVLGAITGWIVFIILEHSPYQQEDYFLALVIVASFLSGFSSKLVIGVISQGINAIERAAGIERRPKQSTIDKG